MREREQILDLWREMRNTASSGVLVTVVKTLGSSYRRPGARMLLAESGKRAGSISGGCLEDDVIKKAWWLTEKGPVVRRYDTTPDGEIGPNGEAGGGFGLGCNGIIYLLLERISGADAEVCPLALLERVHTTRKNCLLATVLEPKADAGRKLVRESDQWSTWGTALNEGMAGRVSATGQHLMNSTVERLESGEEVFSETANTTDTSSDMRGRRRCHPADGDGAALGMVRFGIRWAGSLCAAREVSAGARSERTRFGCEFRRCAD